MKKFLGLLLIILLLGSNVFATDKEGEFDVIDEYIKIYGQEIQEGVDSLNQDDISKIFPKFSVEEVLADASKGSLDISIGAIISRLLELLFEEIRGTLKLLLLIPAIVILNTYLGGLADNFKSKGAIQAAFFVCYVIMAGVASAAFMETVKCSRAVIENISVFMRVLIPVSLASLASGGAIISATTFELVLMSIIEITQLAVEKLFVPLVMAATALNVANNISDSFNAEKLVQFIGRTIKWGLGVMLTIFVGITGLQGIATGSADGLAVKVTKFAASNLIPMVGGILSETVETVMNCSMVIKNAIGVVGIIVLIAVAVLPIIKMTACLMLFRLCAALIEPIAEKKWVKCISEFGDSVSSVIAMTVTVAVMFVIILTIIINVGNSAILLGR